MKLYRNRAWARRSGLKCFESTLDGELIWACGSPNSARTLKVLGFWHEKGGAVLRLSKVDGYFYITISQTYVTEPENIIFTKFADADCRFKKLRQDFITSGYIII